MDCDPKSYLWLLALATVWLAILVSVPFVIALWALS